MTRARTAACARPGRHARPDRLRGAAEPGGGAAPAAPPAGSPAVVDQDTLDQITAVLDQAQSTLDAVDQEMAADEG